MEIWKVVPNTNNKIEVSNKGNIRSLLRGEPYLLKTQKDKKGYEKVRITINRKKMSFRVHRLVAELFIDNPNNLPQVNHKDGNKSNNSVSNLEWISNIDNVAHAMATGLWKNVLAASAKSNEIRKQPIKAYKDNQILYFQSISEAERYFDSRHITDVLKGRRSHVKGWSFSYERG